VKIYFRTIQTCQSVNLSFEVISCITFFANCPNWKHDNKNKKCVNIWKADWFY